MVAYSPWDRKESDTIEQLHFLSFFLSVMFIDFPVAQLVKNPPEMQETWVLCLSWEDPLEKGTDTHSTVQA